VHDDGHRSLPADLADDAGIVAEEVAGHVVDPVAEWRWTRGDTGRVVVAGTVVIMGAIAASQGVPSWERAVFAFLNGLPASLYPALWAPMQLGNVWVGTAVAGTAAAVVRSRRSTWVLVLTPVVAWFAAKAVKALVGRGRPAAVGLPVVQRGEIETGLGYLSGHATVAFALAGALAAHLRRPWSAIVLVIAGLVGLARIHVGVHLPLDVVGGAACGLLIGEAARVIELRGRRGPRAAGAVSAAWPAGRRSHRRRSRAGPRGEPARGHTRGADPRPNTGQWGPIWNPGPRRTVPCPSGQAHGWRD
jgi:membrane-associated phospholipid phosphatase